jgi:hypothetical protein
VADQVILHFADGSTRSLSGPRYFLLTLLAGMGRDNLSPIQLAQLDLIQQCVYAEEPGGARLVEAIQSLSVPVGEQEDEPEE